MEALAPQTFKKEERLCGKTQIEKLLAKGKNGSVPGMRYIFRTNTECDHARLLVSVPKKIFKRAVKRNLYKRRIRESWRKQKQALDIKDVDVLVMYSSKEMLTYAEIYASVGNIIEKINLAHKKNRQEEK